jgi:macrolide transport system ATP-binding/permease protein
LTAPASTPLSVAPSSLVGRDLAKRYGDRVVLDGVDVTVSPGRVLALVGENGAGKSRLLRLLAGVEEPDRGTVTRPAELGYLGQELVVKPGTTVGGLLARALAPLHAAVHRLEELAGRLHSAPAAQEYAELLDWADRHDAWDASRRAEEAAARLGLAQVSAGQPVATLSGGQRSWLVLAALLTRRPACLLLDEPTNHLDDDATAFLEGVLREMPGVVVVASHDRGGRQPRPGLPRRGLRLAAGPRPEPPRQRRARQPDARGWLVRVPGRPGVCPPPATHDRWLRRRWGGDVLPL